MRKRTLSREAALKILYASDVSKETGRESVKKYWENNDPSSEDIRSFSEVIVFGVGEHQGEIDGVISGFAKNWQLERMATIDRNILRIASFELLYLPGTPSKVIINEAVELAKKYGDKDSSKFVNGILDKVKDKRERSNNDIKE